MRAVPIPAGLRRGAGIANLGSYITNHHITFLSVGFEIFAALSPKMTCLLGRSALSVVRFLTPPDNILNVSQLLLQTFDSKPRRIRIRKNTGYDDSFTQSLKTNAGLLYRIANSFPTKRFLSFKSWSVRRRT